MDFELLLHNLLLLSASKRLDSPVVDFPQPRRLQVIGVVFKLDGVDIRELFKLIPGVEVPHLIDQLFQVLDALLQVSKLFNAELLDDPVVQRVFFYRRFSLILC